MADGKVGGPRGNTKSSKANRLWRNTIQRAIAQNADADILRKIADQLLLKAAEGDLGAIKELGDRIDGKAAQQVVLTGDEDGGPVRVEDSGRPKLTRDEWLLAHGLASAARPAG